MSSPLASSIVTSAKAITESETTFMSPTYQYSKIFTWTWIISGVILILLLLSKIIARIHPTLKKTASIRWLILLLLFLTTFSLATISLILDPPGLIYWTSVGYTPGV